MQKIDRLGWTAGISVFATVEFRQNEAASHL